MRFAGEQVKVFRHDDVSQNHDPVAEAHLFEHLKEKIAVPDGGEERLPLETATRNEVEVTGAVVAMKRPRHE